ncbi:MAG: 1-deoxy-D-xylulose-5-phosphate reductoisomerase [Bacteroidia bacterium]|nr:1-deoxy-D-xylulose-5-phosphate reductoisomerase [Bacteroidia bacterium]
MKKHIAILGSTGSIGVQALNVIENHPDHFEVEVLTANWNSELLIRQAVKHRPKAVVIADKEKYQVVSDALSYLGITVMAGEEQVAEAACLSDIDMVLIAIVGYAGLLPSVKAIQAGKDIALANKETLVIAGELITCMAQENNVSIIPVDSEHSAIFQCMAGEDMSRVEKIYLTASGGPFRGKSLEFLRNVTRREALTHPNWSMGEKITIDSASMMNKGLEVIEARWLFGLSPDQIDVIVHPQSVIHSMVQFVDGSMKAQMGLPDMKLPIQYALAWPERLKSSFRRFSFTDYPNLSFEKPDYEVFRNLTLAFEALARGGNIPCALNAANEVAVKAFLQNRIRFTDMPVMIEKAINRIHFISEPSLSDYISTDQETRIITSEFIQT